jgi:hypothetical protein
MVFNYKIASGTIKKIGFFLFATSWVFWVVLIVITFFMPLPLAQKLILIAVFYVLRQVFLYGALYILKKVYFIRFLRRYRFLRSTARLSREAGQRFGRLFRWFRK